jgi:hypothetical protein
MLWTSDLGPRASARTDGDSLAEVRGPKPEALTYNLCEFV